MNVTSVSGVVAAPLAGFYSATKFALEALTEAARLELGHYGVRVLSVQPGFIETSFGDNSTNYGEDEPPYDELAKLWSEAEATPRAPLAASRNRPTWSPASSPMRWRAQSRSATGPPAPTPS